MKNPLKIVELEYTILEFYEHIVVSRIREEVVFTRSQILDLIKVCTNFYKGKKFAYISKRENNYNVDPTIYVNLERVENLTAIAIVSTRPSSLNMANFEQSFSKVPFSIFLEMAEAEEWIAENMEDSRT